MKINKLIFTAAALTVAGFNSQAADDNAPKGISGIVDFGMVLTSGNTENSTVTGKFEILNDLEKWLHAAKLDIVSAEADGTTTAERYLLNLKSDYKLDNDQFLFAGLIYDVDKFSGFDSQATLIAGYGRNIVNTETFKLSAEIGPGYRRSKFEAGGDESEAILHLGAKAKKIINEASHVEGFLTIDSGSEQTISILDLGYINKLNSALSLKLGFNLKNSSDVPADTESTDTITSVSVLYSF